MSFAERAERTARAAHEGQVDKAGRPYIEHPGRVAASVRGDDRLEAIAWLHDVVEDTGVTIDDLRAEFPDEVITAVDVLTRRTGQSPDEYYALVRANPLARLVKLADMADNSDPARLAHLDEATRARLEQKYAHRRHALG